MTINGRIIQGKVSTQEMYGSIDRLLDGEARAPIAEEQGKAGRAKITYALIVWRETPGRIELIDATLRFQE